MRLRVLLPTETIVDELVSKVVADAENGSFCLLPRHVDFVAALVPGLLAFTRAGGDEEFVAVDEGILAKSGSEVRVSVRNAVRGKEVGQLRQAVEERFGVLEEHERSTRSALARIESDLLRRFLEIES